MLAGLLSSVLWLIFNQKKYESYQDIYIGMIYSESNSELKSAIDVNRYILRFNPKDIKDTKVLSACKKNTSDDNYGNSLDDVKVILKKGQSHIIEVSSIRSAPENSMSCTHELASFIFNDLTDLANLKLEVLKKELALVRDKKLQNQYFMKFDASNSHIGDLGVVINYIRYRDQLENLSSLESKLIGAVSDSKDNLPEMFPSLGKPRILGVHSFVVFILGIFFGAVMGIIYTFINDLIKSRFKKF